MAVSEDRYQKVRVKMWRGETVPGLTRDAKLLWVYLLTSPDTTMIPGIISVGIGSIADDLGYTADEVRAALTEITATGEVEFDPAGLVWFKKALDHNPPDAPNNVKGWRRHWAEVKKCALKEVAWAEIRAWLAEYRGQTFVEAFDLACPRPTNSKNPQNRTPSPTPSPTGYPTPSGTPSPTPLGTPSGTPYRTQYQEQKQEQKQKKPAECGRAGAYTCESAHEAGDGPMTQRTPAVQASLPLAPPEPVAAPDAPEAPPARPTARTGQPEGTAGHPLPSSPPVPAPVAPVPPVASPAPAAVAPAPAARPVPAAEPMSPQSATILTELRRHPALACIATVTVADKASAMLVGQGLTVADVTAGIVDLAGKVGMMTHPPAPDAIATWLPGYAKTAARRRRDGATRGPARLATVAPPQPRDPGKQISPYGNVITFDDEEDAPPAARPANDEPGARMAGYGYAAGGAR